VSDYPGDDPFVDSGDPDAVARAERRREREEKRATKRGKKAPKEPTPPPPPKETPPAPPRTPEQEFWDEPGEPAPPATPQPPVPGQAPSEPPKPDPDQAKAGRRRLLGRRRNKGAAAGVAGAAAGAAAASEGAVPSGAAGAGAAGPPTSEGPVPKPAAPPGAAEPTVEALLPKKPTESQGTDAPPTAESPAAKAPPTPPGESPTGEQSAAGPTNPPTGKAAAIDAAGPPTAEQPMPKPPGQPDDQQPPVAAGPPTAESRLPDDESAAAPGPPTTESRPPEDKSSGAAAAGGAAAAAGQPASETPGSDVVRPASDAPRPDPGPSTADAPRPDPNQPTAAAAVPGDAAGPSTREHRAPVPIPVDQTGAGDWEPPPPRDDDWFDTGEHDFHEDGDPTMAGAARTGRRHGEGGRGGGILRRIFRHPFLIVAAIILIVVLIFANGLFQPFHGSGNGKVAVNIPKGSSVGEVGDLLEKKGVISGGTLFVSGSTMFQARVTLAGKRSEIFPGQYTMAKDMSYGDAISQLSKETEPKVAKAKSGILTITIPEGQSRPITAKLLKEDGIKGSYMKATKKSKLLNPEKYGGKNVKDLEGFLFPDTWEYRTNKPVKDLVALQLQDFKKKIKKVNLKYAKSKNLTIFDVVTIASMIEREAGVPKQRKLVASVIYNRLHEGMTLGIDSTIRFATGNYEKPLTQSELESESPYNTRTHAGLPPGPINSPGLAALNAAAHPAKTQFLFYVNNPNSCNELTFAKTEAEFEADAEKYEAAREKNGGNEPSTCK
jgi:UPF0755 protein